MLDLFLTNCGRVAVEHSFQRRARDVTETLTDDGLVIPISSTVFSHTKSKKFAIVQDFTSITVFYLF